MQIRSNDISSLERLLEKVTASKTAKVFLYVLFGTLMLWALFTSIYMEAVNRSLWVDESMLAWSICNRTVGELLREPLDWVQSAPVIWLYIVKIISNLFRQNEMVLRSFSVIAYVGIALLNFIIQRKHFNIPDFVALGSSAYIMTMTGMLQYSNMFKPYMSDGMFVFLLILFWLLYEKGTMKLWQFTTIFCVMIMASNPTLFIGGGLLLTSFFSAVIDRDKKKAIGIFIGGIFVIFVFIVYYFLWLYGISKEMKVIWKGREFPLLFFLNENFQKAYGMIKGLSGGFDRFGMLMYVLFLLSIVVAIYERNKCLIGIYIGVFLSLLASNFGYFPINFRLCLFSYPLIVMVDFICVTKLCEKIVKKRYVRALILCVFCFALVFGNKGPAYYAEKENIYWQGEEIKDEVEYLDANINSDESVYVYRGAVPGFQYYNGYDSYDIGGFDDNIIYGVNIFSPEDDYMGEIEQIVAHPKCYIAISHYSTERLQGLIEETGKAGCVELIQNTHSTPLLFWSDRPENMKTRVDLKVKDMELNGSEENATIILTNIGNTCINTEFGKVYLYCEETDQKFEFDENIASGGATEISVEYPLDINSPTFWLVNDYGNDICINNSIRL